jgi:hypothetical protein
MEKVLEQFKIAMLGIQERIGEIERRIKSIQTPSLFEPRRAVTLNPPEPCEERTSSELAITQQFRKNHGDAMFLMKVHGRGNFFHSLDSQGGGGHVHVPGAMLDQDVMGPHTRFYLGGQLREIVRQDGKKELQYIRYIANNKTSDPRHPVFEEDQNIRILEVVAIAVDGEFVINDTDIRRSLS